MNLDKKSDNPTIFGLIARILKAAGPSVPSNIDIVLDQTRGTGRGGTAWAVGSDVPVFWIRSISCDADGYPVQAGTVEFSRGGEHWTRPETHAALIQEASKLFGS